jgi:hypothetical protein
MLALLLVVSAGLLGAGIVRRLPIATTRLERTCLAGAIALTAGPWILLLAAWSLGFAIALPLAGTAMALAGIALARAPATPPLAIAPTSRLSWLALGLVFAGLFHGHMFHVEAGGLFTGGSSYGDLALHATLANRFAVGEVSFASPLVAGEPLTYPFLGDFLVACLLRGGWSLSTAFAVTGWISILIGLGMIQALAVRLFRNRAAATLAVWLIVLSGSAVGALYAVEDLAVHGLPAQLADLPNYSHMRPRGVAFASFACDFFLPQRALLAALPGFWAAVWAVAVGVETRARAAIIAGGAAIGLLPLIHVHSFLVGLGLVGWLAVWHAARARSSLRTWTLALAAMLALATPQLAWQFGHSWSSGFGGWDVGWLARSGGWWWFWLRQWGLALVVLPVIVVAAARHDRRFLLPFVLSALLLFGAANLYRFQPHDWDNMKFLVYAYMMLAIAIAGWLARALAGGAVRRAGAVLAIVSLTATGALSVAREADLHDQIASTADLALAAELGRVLPPDARVLTADAHNHLVPMLTGRAVVMGYRGWLWTHGIDYKELERAVGRMFALDADAPQLFARYGVTHVYIGPGEHYTLHAALERYRAQYRAVLVRPEVEVFDVRPQPGALARAPRSTP